MTELNSDQLQEIRVNAIIKAFVLQRDNALSQQAALSAEKAVLEAQLSEAYAQVSFLSLSLTAEKDARQKGAEQREDDIVPMKKNRGTNP